MSPKPAVAVNDPKVNGFSKPLHHLQLLSWIVFAYLNLSFHAVYGCHARTLFIIFNLVHLLLSVTAFASAYSATNANVVDPYVQERGFPIATMKISDFKAKHESLIKRNEFLWCKHCNWYVSKHSKHCRACNRCTAHFDHHCRWLNNCISQQNYKSFVLAVASTATMLVYEIVLGALMLAARIDISAHILMAYSSSYTVIHTLIAFHIFMATAMLIPLWQLLLFHLYLYHKQVTTYTWLIQREEMRVEKIAKDAVKQHKKRSSKSSSAQKYVHQQPTEDNAICGCPHKRYDNRLDVSPAKQSVAKAKLSSNSDRSYSLETTDESRWNVWWLGISPCSKARNVIHINDETSDKYQTDHTAIAQTEKSVFSRPGNIDSAPPAETHEKNNIDICTVPLQTEIVIFTEKTRESPLRETRDIEEVQP